MTPRQKFWSGVVASITIGGFLITLWTLYRSEADRPPEFKAEAVYFNEYNQINDEFLRFLRKNDGEKVVVNTVFDFSPFFVEHYDTLNKCNNAYPAQGQSEAEFLAAGGTFDLLDGKIFNRPLRIPHHHRWGEGLTDDCPSTLEILVNSPRENAPKTHGGTGVVRMTVRGSFIVHQNLSGAMETLTLREVDVDEN
ncbi:hypothetical protein SAMN02787020_2767 [Brevundimonas sp. 374]|nr:hypothetical protein SAMN02787020_2767 [Brevundimonas sp. 374]